MEVSMRSWRVEEWRNGGSAYGHGGWWVVGVVDGAIERDVVILGTVQSDYWQSYE